MKIRNISGEDLTIGYGFFGPRTVKAGDEIDVPDEAAPAYLERVDGDDTVPSDLWASAEAAKPAPVALTEQ